MRTASHMRTTLPLPGKLAAVRCWKVVVVIMVIFVVCGGCSSSDIVFLR